MENLTLYSLIALVAVFLFFTLPSSKRSVYLMPAYPFIAWFAARFFCWLGESVKGRKGIVAYGSLLGGIAILIEVALLLYRWVIPYGAIRFSGRHAAANMAMLDAVGNPDFLGWIAVGVLFAAGLVWFVGVARRGWSRSGGKMLCGVSVLTLMLFLTFDVAIQPAVLNVKSIKGATAEMRQSMEEGLELYEFLSMSDEAVANRYHFFELDFYMDDQVRNFRKHQPSEGYLAILPSEVETWLPQFEQEGYRFIPFYLLTAPARKEEVAVYRFRRG